MKSIKTVYKTGYGPSSSHTMVPAYAAEVALEHHLGLTCDPICGLIQIPCNERNAVAAMRAVQTSCT